MHPTEGWQSWRPFQGKRNIVPLSWSCNALILEMESRLGLCPESTCGMGWSCKLCISSHKFAFVSYYAPPFNIYSILVKCYEVGLISDLQRNQWWAIVIQSKKQTRLGKPSFYKLSTKAIQYPESDGLHAAPSNTMQPCSQILDNNSNLTFNSCKESKRSQALLLPPGMGMPLCRFY